VAADLPEVCFDSSLVNSTIGAVSKVDDLDRHRMRLILRSWKNLVST